MTSEVESGAGEPVDEKEKVRGEGKTQAVESGQARTDLLFREQSLAENAPEEGRIALQAVMQVASEPPEKRVVPRSLYVRIQAWKASLRVSGFLYGVLGLACALLVTYFGYSLVVSLLLNDGAVSWEGVSVVVASSVVGIGVAVMELRNCQEMGSERLEQAKRIAPVAPLTRANTAHLPAKESLVRPSSPSEQAMRDMLRPASVHEAIPEQFMLRAVTAQPNQIPVEQMVRPAAGPDTTNSE